MEFTYSQVTGVTGQLGQYLAELLLSKEYEVHGIIRTISSSTSSALHGTEGEDPSPCTKLKWFSPLAGVISHQASMEDATRLNELIRQIQPDEVYSLAAESHVGKSWQDPEKVFNINALGPLRLLQAIVANGIVSKTRFVQVWSIIVLLREWSDRCPIAGRLVGDVWTDSTTPAKRKHSA